MTEAATFYYLGPVAAWGEQLAERLGAPVQAGLPDRAGPTDVVFLAVRTDPRTAAALVGANAFATCRALKSASRARVFLLTEPGDAFSPELARFCLADGCIELAADGSLGDLAVVEACLRAAGERAPIEELLGALEAELASDAGRRESVVQRLLGGERDHSLTDQLTDPATGLLSGPYASLKLEEEFKRAQRFHQPLSLVLLEIGLDSERTDEPGAAPAAGLDLCVTEVAGVLLNECRDIDVLARFSEAAFLLLLPGTGAAGATALVDRVVSRLRAGAFGGRQLNPYAGVATVPAAGITHRREFLARAEARLQLACDGRGVDAAGASCE
jgi:GGDEF domain-containing protein